MKPERRFWKPDVSQDVDDELMVHLELRQRELVERGLDPVEAREIAARRFGDVQAIAAACRNIDERWYREHRRASMWMDLRQDVTYGLRVLRKSPGFVLAAVASLSIGIAATAAVFSMLNALLLRSLPGVTDSSRLAAIYTVAPRIPTGSATDESVYRWYREVLTPFSGIAGFARTSVAVGLGHEPFAASAVLVTDTYFDVLGTQPSAGGLIDASVYHQPVVVVSHEFAERHFGRADAAPGRAFAINGHPFQVAGVTPPRFVGATPGGLGGDPAQRPQLWIPLTMHRMVQQGMMRLINPQGEQASNQETVWLSLVGRLAPGVTLAAARAQAATVPPHGTANRPADARPIVTPLGHGPRERPWEMVAIIALMFSVPLIVLAIGCGNTANLQLARASGREGEIAIRRSLGATRGRVVRQLLVESLIVALLAVVVADAEDVAQLVGVHALPGAFGLRGRAAARVGPDGRAGRPRRPVDVPGAATSSAAPGPAGRTRRSRPPWSGTSSSRTPARSTDSSWPAERKKTKSKPAGTSAPASATQAARPSVRMLRLHVSPAGQPCRPGTPWRTRGPCPASCTARTR